MESLCLVLFKTVMVECRLTGVSIQLLNKHEVVGVPLLTMGS